MKPKIELQFNCQEPLESMRFNSKGFHCNACSKQVINYTNHSIHEILKLKDSIQCGIFKPEQLNPELKPIHFSINLKNLIITCCSLMGIASSRSFGQSPMHKDSIELSSVIVDHSVPIDSNCSKNKNTCEENKHASCSASNQNNHNKNIGRRRWYSSRSFPFIHYKRSFYGFSTQESHHHR